MALDDPVRAVLPEGLRHLEGEIMDVDSHEMMPAQAWVPECGEVARFLANEWLNNGESFSNNPNHPNVPGWTADDMPADPETIWRVKGSVAPGSVDLARRDEVMDLMGVKRQLMFATGVGMWGVFLVMAESDMEMMSNITEGRREYGLELIKAYNAWGIRTAGDSDRVRACLPLVGDTVEEFMENARHLIDNGIRSLWLPATVLPGGKSPAHSAIDPFWEMCADRNVSVCLHVGSDKPLDSGEWRNAEVFENFKILGEFSSDPWSLSVNHIAIQNFLATVVVGGVFERHPALRFGAIEAAAHWIGPLCESLDMWHGFGAAFGTAKSFRLPRKPSEYIRSNVRVSVFDFEPVDVYLKRYPLLEDVLCFATDYPHVEGGKNAIFDLYDKLEDFPQEVIDKFFAHNGAWLLPD